MSYCEFTTLGFQSFKEKVSTAAETNNRSGTQKNNRNGNKQNKQTAAETKKQPQRKQTITTAAEKQKKTQRKQNKKTTAAEKQPQRSAFSVLHKFLPMSFVVSLRVLGFELQTFSVSVV